MALERFDEGRMLLTKESFGHVIWDCYEDKIRAEAEYVKHKKQYAELDAKLRSLQRDWCRLHGFPIEDRPFLFEHQLET